MDKKWTGEKSEQRKNGQAGGTKDTSGTPHTTAGIFGQFNTLVDRRRATDEDEPRRMRIGGDEKWMQKNGWSG